MRPNSTRNNTALATGQSCVHEFKPACASFVWNVHEWFGSWCSAICLRVLTLTHDITKAPNQAEMSEIDEDAEVES